MMKRQLHFSLGLVIIALLPFFSFTAHAQKGMKATLGATYKFGDYSLVDPSKGNISENGNFFVLTTSNDAHYLWNVLENRMIKARSGSAYTAISNGNTIIGCSDVRPASFTLDAPEQPIYYFKDGVYGCFYDVTPDGSKACGFIATEDTAYKYLPAVCDLATTSYELLPLPNLTQKGYTVENAILLSTSKDANVVAGELLITVNNNTIKVFALWVKNDQGQYVNVDLYEKLDASGNDGKYYKTRGCYVSPNGKFVAYNEVYNDGGDAIHKEMVRYEVATSELKRLSVAKGDIRVDGIHGCELTDITDSGMAAVALYNNDSYTVNQCQSMFLDFSDGTYTTLKDVLANQDPAISIDPKSNYIVSYVDTENGKTIVLYENKTREENNSSINNPTLSIINFTKKETPSDDEPDNNDWANFGSDGHILTKELGNGGFFLRAARLANDKKLAAISFSSLNVVWDIKKNDFVQFPNNIIPIDVASNGIMLAYDDNAKKPLVGKPGEWITLSVPSGNYAVPSGISDNGLYVVGFHAAMNDDADQGIPCLWEVATNRLIELPEVSFPDELSVAISAKNALEITDDGNVIMGQYKCHWVDPNNADNTDIGNIVVLWKKDPSTNSYVAVDIYKSFFNEVGVGTYRFYEAKALSGNGTWLTGSANTSREFNGSQRIMYDTYLYNIETGKVEFFRTPNPRDYELALEAMAVTNKGFAFAAANAFRSITNALPYYCEPNNNRIVTPFATLLETKGITDFNLYAISNIVAAVTPTADAYLYYGEDDSYNEYLSLIKFDTPVQIPLAIEEVQDDATSIKVYPTIIDNTFMLEGAKGMVYVYTMNGSQVLAVEATEAPLSIDATHWVQGSYILRNGTNNIKLIKK